MCSWLTAGRSICTRIGQRRGGPRIIPKRFYVSIFRCLPNTTSAWAGLRNLIFQWIGTYGGVHSLLLCTSSTWDSPTCQQARQQEYTY